MWPDATPVERVLEGRKIPMYGRAFEIIRPDLIDRMLYPEIEAQRALAQPATRGEEVFAALVRELSISAQISEEVIGLNGSYARGLAVPESDFDLDIYGREACLAVSMALSTELVERKESHWERRWPPDRQTNLYYVREAAYPDWSLQDLWTLFQASGREVFNFLYQGVKVSIAYHTHDRDETFRAWPQVEQLERARWYTGVFADNRNLGHLEYPAFVELEDVAGDGGQQLGDATVISYSKAFCYSRRGDVVRFRAQEASGEDDCILVIPAYGPEWPVQILESPEIK
jgi:predicted nucleotidyltransferase